MLLQYKHVPAPLLSTAASYSQYTIRPPTCPCPPAGLPLPVHQPAGPGGQHGAPAPPHPVPGPGAARHRRRHHRRGHRLLQGQRVLQDVRDQGECGEGVEAVVDQSEAVAAEVFSEGHWVSVALRWPRLSSLGGSSKCPTEGPAAQKRPSVGIRWGSL